MICDDLMIGGWTTIAGVIPELRKKLNIYVICLFGGGPFAEELERQGIKIYYFNINKYNLPLKIVQLALFFMKHDIDIVHTNLHLSHIIGQTTALLCRKKRIMHMHSLEKKTKGLTGLWKSFLVSKTHMVIPVSNASRNAFMEVYPGYKNKLKVIYNGIDIESFQKAHRSSGYSRSDFGLPRDSFIFITVANLKWEKGYEHLIEAAEKTPENIHFMIVGNGYLRDPLIKKVNTAGLSARFHFVGQRRDIPDLLSLADAFILPSILEGFPICIIEALSASLPIIATNVGGIPEMLTNMNNSIVVPPSDTQNLSNAINKLYEDSALRKKLSKNALETVKGFDIRAISEKYRNAYIELTAKQ